MNLFNRKKKVFVIGAGKTGTTSLAAALKDLGYRIGDQAKGELLLEDWSCHRFSEIIQLCKTADAFQDVPFSLPHTYEALDEAFPNSQFILSIRNSSQQWFESLTRFHTKFIGKNRLPTVEDLKSHSYRTQGWLWRFQELVYKIGEKDLYNPKIYIPWYEKHNETVKAYFQNREKDLLVLNVSQANSMQTLCEFLGVPYKGQTMPWLEKTT